MLTQDIINLFQGPIIVGLATANQFSRPFFTRAFAAAGEPGGSTLDVFIPQIMAERPLADLRENDRIAAVVGDVTNFKALQFKGRLLNHSPATSDEQALVGATLLRLLPVLAQFFGPGMAEGWSRYIVEPALRLRIQMSEIYDQTPRSGAGQRIS